MKPIHTDRAPQAIGPYSQAIEVDGWLYTSGQIGLDPETQEMAEGFEAQARQVLSNLDAVLQAAGAERSDIVKATIYVADLGSFGRLNELYGEWLREHKPARSTVQAARLPKDALVEIDLVVRLPR